MPTPTLLIDKQTRQRFVLGQQGLWPGRRWQGKEGVVQALQAGCVVQVDPLQVAARSHDIALYGRVLDYHPQHLDEVLYLERKAFDYGGTVMVYPIEELPFRRVAMARKQNENRWVEFASQHAAAIEFAISAVKERGPLGSRQLVGKKSAQFSYRSGKDTGQALYYLWLAGELMTHSRNGFERLYDLRQRVAPRHLDYTAPVDEAEDYFALRAFKNIGIAHLRSWRNWFAGDIGRKVELDEASGRIQALLDSGMVVQVDLEGEAKTPYYVLAEYTPLLEELQAGRIPESWQPVGSTSRDEAVFLAPLEIVSARGRSRQLFGFEYLWEVYKPAEQRKWGYYTLPVLYRDQLVARFDAKVERTSGKLQLKGFWLEDGLSVDDSFRLALKAGLNRFARLCEAADWELTRDIPANIREVLR